MWITKKGQANLKLEQDRVRAQEETAQEGTQEHTCSCSLGLDRRRLEHNRSRIGKALPEKITEGNRYKRKRWRTNGHHRVFRERGI